MIREWEFVHVITCSLNVLQMLLTDQEDPRILVGWIKYYWEWLDKWLHSKQYVIYRSVSHHLGT